jgi:acetolactate synthase-1/2/3 large subunit
MGWAIPAAIGAKLARPDLPCVAITGDGCMLMHGMEIQTAAHRNLDIIFLVSNNSALGNVWLRAHDTASGRGITELTTHDWVGFAKSLGADGERVDDPADLIGAYTRAFAATGPYVLDIRTDRTATTPITPWRARTATAGVGPRDLSDTGEPAAFLGYADS